MNHKVTKSDADGLTGIDVRDTGPQQKPITEDVTLRIAVPDTLDHLAHKFYHNTKVVFYQEISGVFFTAICYGSTSCPNGGTCSLPNTCVCAPGFGGPQCADVNECQLGTHNCQQLCTNTFGSFTCSCRTGYTLNSDLITCTDIDECVDSNGGCSEYCRNEDGSYECYCKTGLHVASDGKTCIDIDECSSNNGGCEQVCKNDHAVFRCECYSGFSIHTDGQSCQDVDECLGSNKCTQSCNNTIGSYTCSCNQDYQLETMVLHALVDINDCVGVRCLNDGSCLDFPGLYTCKCKQGFEGKHCETDIDECLYLNGGCEDQCEHINGSFHCECRGSTTLDKNGVSCRGVGNGLEIKLSSTDSWYRLNSNSSIHYTYGIVFAEAEEFSIPISVSGLVVATTSFSFELFTGSVLYLETDGTKLSDMHDDSCLLFNTTPKDIYDFVSSGSFIGTVFDSLRNKLPSWLQFSKSGVGLLSNLGGTIFIMPPAETGAELSKFGIFSDLTKTGLTLTPRGIGLSLGKDINVHYKTSELELWNGDEMFYYRVFESANVWLYAGIEYASRSDSLNIDLKGEADIFLAVPSVSSLLIDIFMEQWNGLLQFKHFSINPTVRLDFWRLNITFVIKTIASLEVYTSVGGEDNRIWCGNAANPPGIFASFLVDYNPFKSIPLLENWMFAAAVKIHAFVTAEEKLSLQTEIDVVNNILQTKDIVERFLNLVDDFRNESTDVLSGALQQLLSKLSFSVSELSSCLTDILNSQSSLQNISTSMKLLWDKFITIKKTTRKLLDELEFHAGKFVANLTNLLESEIARIGRNIDLTISRITRITSKVFSVVKSYTGAGFRFTAFVRIFSLDFSSMGVELVHPIKLGYFLSLDTHVALSIAIGNGKFVAHAHIDVSVLGMKASGDLLISSNGLYVVIEGNIWNVFLARVTLSVELGRKWYQLTFALKGILLAPSHKQASNTAANSDFQVSYLTGIRLITKNLADEANKRLTAVQNGLYSAQKALTRAQQKLSNAQNKVRDCHSSFDNAMSKLETVKRKVDAAKIPLDRALETLRKAQRNVDNLCRIRDCPHVCVPGWRCRWCGGWIRYPCCRFTSCMFKIPNFVCEAANLFCREGILEVAKFGLEAAKGGLDVAKGAIEAVKLTVKAGLYVFDLLVLGIQQLIDVKNCGFEIEMSTHDKALFELQVFLVNEKEVMFLSRQSQKKILRLFKRDTFDNSNNQTMYLNDTIFQDGNWTSDIEYTIEYFDRMKYFEHNCKLFNNVHSFLTISSYYFINISDETVHALNESTHYRNEIQNITSYSTVNTMTLESAGISEEYAYNDYNLTIDELNAVMEDVKINLKKDPVMSEIANVTELAYRMVDSGIDEANSLPLVNLWMLGMENFTFDFFDENDCSNFQDCLQHAFSVFYDLFSDDSIENTESNKNLTVTIEDNILMLILNDSLSIQDMYKISLKINDSLNDLMEANMFCSTPPTFSSPLHNTTVLVGDYLSLLCNATGDPDPAISWFFNDKRLQNETNPELRYDQATTVLSGQYRCIAGNVVLNTTSDKAYVNVIDIDECITNVSRCEQNCKNTNGSFTCSCKWIYELAADGKSCSELSMLLNVMVCTFIGIAALVVGVITLKIWKGRQTKNNKIRPTFINVCESIQSPPKDHSFILNRKMELTSHT
ncbi:Fibrillin-1 [Mytilus coruscus]|uniref:Fibrillin-1 n=1 Tax=Mytilus coruscus TaxID=42192 RepID=A0A6J8EJJ3_MYTCO|nr:Fibrillin-1 [Mytilus coruscus]